jgi:hypothetical protein
MSDMAFRMMRQRTLARFACLLAVLGGHEAVAQQVYRGCAVPDQAPRHVFTIDPVNGDDAGDGSKGHPWKSLQAVFGLVDGASPLLSTAPYRHRSPVDQKFVTTPNADAPIKPGDAVQLMSGDYGVLNASVSGEKIVNSDFVTIEAAPGAKPVFSQLSVSGVNKLRFRGLKVESPKTDPKTDWRPLVLVSPPTQDIILDGLSLSSQEDISGWSQEDWRAKGRIGVWVRGHDQATCTTIANTNIFNVTFGALLFGDRLSFANNVINNFGDDGLDYGGNDLVIAHNRITNGNTVADGEHLDAMQGQPDHRLADNASDQYSNILIEGNVVIRQTGPHLKFPSYLQGIDAFDDDWRNVTVTNNVVITSACWGIAYGSLHRGRIVNNTVLDDNLIPMPGDCKPIIAVSDKTHQGSSSNDVIVRNNIANGYSIDNRDSDVVMDHNVCATIKGYCRILSYVGGKPQWGVVKSGFHGDHNLTDEEGTAAEFANFDPAKLIYDLRLKPRAQAIGAGSPAEAPPADITGLARGSRIDAGAYGYSSTAGSEN